MFIVACVRIADVDPAQARVMLARAKAVAADMQAKGILAPSDAWLPDELGKRIAQLKQ